ncbi:MAG: metal ABC transporter permease [Patescibacteria group bacterium]|nr:metal ABC transporter permease [Patescibacteria group bacterium]
MIPPSFYAITLAIFAAAAAGLVGSFALMKRTVLAGDVISHIAIPGLGLALIWNINPLVGGATTLLIGTIIIWQLEKKTSLSSEAAIGVIFSSSVALGALLINSNEELIDALFGGFGILSYGEFTFGIVASMFVIATLLILRHKLIIGLFSEDLAVATKINTRILHLVFLLVFALTVLLGLRFLGALLAGSLIIIPASAARQFSHTLGMFLSLSMLIAVLSVGIGFAVASIYSLSTGPTIVMVAAVFFILSLARKTK